MMKYTALANNDASFSIEKSSDGFFVNGQHKHTDLIKLDKDRYHLLINNASFTIEIIKAVGKEVQLVVNGTPYSVVLSDEYDSLLKDLGISTAGNTKSAGLKAPMPGLVLKLLVNEGDEVKKGDNLLVLEAMKMENMIKAQDVCTIKSVRIKAGQTVEKGQILLSFF